MPAEKATALVLRTTDWSETSRIATLWTREFGKIRVLAKGGRRLKSNFENALDLLTLCGIVFLRKSSGGLDLLTEAQVTRRFPRLRDDLSALYASYYVAELLADLTEEYDPHPALFDVAVAALDRLGAPLAAGAGPPDAAWCVMRFEMALLQELGYSPALEACAACGGPPDRRRLWFSAEAGGVLCPACQAGRHDRRPLSPTARDLLQALRPDAAETPDRPWRPEVRREVRQVLSGYVAWLLGRRPRLSPYLGS